MGEIKIFDSELLLMEYLWEHGPCIAADLAEEFLKRYNWKKSTTYIVLKRLEGKGAISREYPKYLVTPIVTRAERRDQHPGGPDVRRQLCQPVRKLSELGPAFGKNAGRTAGHDRRKTQQRLKGGAARRPWTCFFPP